MNAVVLLVVGVAILVAGYIFYGGWLAKQWGLGENKEGRCFWLDSCYAVGFDRRYLLRCYS